MIWAPVSCRSCFCWLYRVSPSLTEKNLISLILVLTIWWCPCVESLVLLEECVCYDQHILLAKLLAFALLHFLCQGQTCLLCQVSFDFLFLHSSPLWWIGHMKWTEIILSFLKLHSSVAFQTLVEYEGYSISSKGFLPAAVDIIVIWIKFAYSSPFKFTDF